VGLGYAQHPHARPRRLTRQALTRKPPGYDALTPGLLAYALGRYAALPLEDAFAADVPAGAVIGSAAPDGVTVRHGRSNGAWVSRGSLKIPPGGGYGENSVSWSDAPGGPVERKAGVAAVFQFTAPDPAAARFAVGFFPGKNPADPLPGSAALEVFPTGSTVSGWRAKDGAGWLDNEESHLMAEAGAAVVLRSREALGHAVFTWSVPGARNTAGYPEMEVLAFDTRSQGDLKPGVHHDGAGDAAQVVRFKALQLSGVSGNFPFAHLGDRGVGAGNLGAAPAEVGGSWKQLDGSNYPDDATLVRTARGIQHDGGGLRRFFAFPGAKSRLVGCDVENAATPADSLVYFRVQDANNCWFVRLFADWKMTVERIVGGVNTVVYQTGAYRPTNNDADRVRVWLRGPRIKVFLNGMLTANLDDPDLMEAAGIGFGLDGPAGGSALRDLFAYPEAIAIPAQFGATAPFGAPGGAQAVDDPFDGAAGQELAGPWVKESGGALRLEHTGSGAVKPSGPLNQAVNLAYYRPWGGAGYAHLEATLLCPPNAFDPGQNHFQGVYVGDGAGGSIGWFGFANEAQGPTSTELEVTEDDTVRYRTNLYDALQAAQPYTLKVITDGDRWVAYVDGEPVMSRARTQRSGNAPLSISRVGVIARDGDNGAGEFRHFSAYSQSSTLAAAGLALFDAPALGGVTARLEAASSAPGDLAPRAQGALGLVPAARGEWGAAHSGGAQILPSLAGAGWGDLETRSDPALASLPQARAEADGHPQAGQLLGLAPASVGGAGLEGRAGPSLLWGLTGAGGFDAHAGAQPEAQTVAYTSSTAHLGLHGGTGAVLEAPASGAARQDLGLLGAPLLGLEAVAAGAADLSGRAGPGLEADPAALVRLSGEGQGMPALLLPPGGHARLAADLSGRPGPGFGVTGAAAFALHATQSPGTLYRASAWSPADLRGGANPEAEPLVLGFSLGRFDLAGGGGAGAAVRAAGVGGLGMQAQGRPGVAFTASASAGYAQHAATRPLLAATVSGGAGFSPHAHAAVSGLGARGAAVLGLEPAAGPGLGLPARSRAGGGLEGLASPSLEGFAASGLAASDLRGGAGLGAALLVRYAVGLDLGALYLLALRPGPGAALEVAPSTPYQATLTLKEEGDE
jgi:hypothetical protein